MVTFGIAALGLQPPPEAVEKYGVFQSVSIPKLFIAGVLPGLVIAGSLLILFTATVFGRLLTKPRAPQSQALTWDPLNT